MWAATVEYWRDMAIGPTVLAQAAESMRKIRNSARFILGNIGDAETRARMKRVSRADMGLVSLESLLFNKNIFHLLSFYVIDRLNAISCTSCTI